MFIKPSIILSSIILLLLIYACEKPRPINQEEIINRIELHLTDSKGKSYEVRYFDEDGEGTKEPVADTLFIPSEEHFTCYIALFNTLVTPTANITSEIAEESAEHQFFYLTGPGSGLEFSYDDEDMMNHPIGLRFKLSSGGAESEKLNIILRHMPDKTAQYVMSGDITNAGGETDIDIIIPVVVK